MGWNGAGDQRVDRRRTHNKVPSPAEPITQFINVEKPKRRSSIPFRTSINSKKPRTHARACHAKDKDDTIDSAGQQSAPSRENKPHDR